MNPLFYFSSIYLFKKSLRVKIISKFNWKFRDVIIKEKIYDNQVRTKKLLWKNI